jgi:hypothetical protein
VCDIDVVYYSRVIDKARAKDKTYVWVSEETYVWVTRPMYVWWKTKMWRLLWIDEAKANIKPIYECRCNGRQQTKRLTCLGDKAHYQAFFWVLIDLIVELLDLIIKLFDNQTERWNPVSNDLIIKSFDTIIW